jgi:hypothetical protein
VAVPLCKGDLVVNRDAANLIPGDPFLLEMPEYGILSMVMRCRKIGLGRREDGKVTMSAVQDEFASPELTTVVPPVTDHETEDYPALDVVTSLVWELPDWLAKAMDGERAGYYRLAAFAAAPSAVSVDYTAWIDEGGAPADDTEALTASVYTEHAQLNADLGQYDGWVAGFLPTLTIKEVSDASVLVDGSTATVRAGQGLVLLNGELLAYETFTDNGDGTFDLETVYRSLLDTGYQAGAEDDVLWFIEGTLGFFEDVVLPVAQSVYLVDHTFTDYLDESVASRHAITPVGRKDLPMPPDDVTLEGVRALGEVMNVDVPGTVAWAERAPSTVSIPVEVDATQTPAAGTVYKLQVWTLGGGLVFTADDIAGASYEYAPAVAAQGLGELRVYAKLTGALSYSYAAYPIEIIGDSLVVDGVLVYIDTDTVEFT